MKNRFEHIVTNATGTPEGLVAGTPASVQSVLKM